MKMNHCTEYWRSILGGNTTINWWRKMSFIMVVIMRIDRVVVCCIVRIVVVVRLVCGVVIVSEWLGWVGVIRMGVVIFLRVVLGAFHVVLGRCGRIGVKVSIKIIVSNEWCIVSVFLMDGVGGVSRRATSIIIIEIGYIEVTRLCRIRCGGGDSIVVCSRIIRRGRRRSIGCVVVWWTI